MLQRNRATLCIGWNSTYSGHKLLQTFAFSVCCFFCFYFVLTLNDLEHAKITFTLLKLINSFYNAV